ncbi:hypothetical protein DFH11DRAFT_63114 [Phellopilus nigrolimitatus]|nr:hypothetical protein DFH11DRAFT_63114 [Phellopilus nigrolimitatus]
MLASVRLRFSCIVHLIARFVIQVSTLSRPRTNINSFCNSVRLYMSFVATSLLYFVIEPYAYLVSTCFVCFSVRHVPEGIIMHLVLLHNFVLSVHVYFDMPLYGFPL